MTRVQCTVRGPYGFTRATPHGRSACVKLVIPRPIRGSQVTEPTQSGPGFRHEPGLGCPARSSVESVCGGSSSHMMMVSLDFRVLFSEIFSKQIEEAGSLLDELVENKP